MPDSTRYPIFSKDFLSDPDLQEIFKALASLSSSQEVEKVLGDTLTPRELRTLKKRWQTIKLVARKLPYRVIAQQLRISTTTVARAALSFEKEKEGWEILLRSV